MQATEAAVLQPYPAMGQMLVLANGLKWLAPEIDASLHRVRVLLDQQQEADEGNLELSAVLAELKLVLGALRMASCHGGAMLAEELCNATLAVAGGTLAAAASTLAAVSGATLQLSDYLDALRQGAPDRAAVLQPAISELRLASGRATATEADLFVRQMQLIDVPLPLPQDLDRVAAAGVVAAKLLPAFQTLLLQWLRGVDVANSLLRLRKLGDHIAANALRPEIILLWSAFAAAIDSLVNVPGSESLELKRWIGRLGQQMKLLAEQGEDVAAGQAHEIAWRLMAHAAPIHCGGDRWLLLRQYLPLDSTLPVEPELAQARQHLRGPNTRLLEKVADEVRLDLALVKDGLDLALRSGGLAPDAQDSLRERLTRIANTLLLLGLPQLEQVLRNQARDLAGLGSGAAENQGQWMRVATALLWVEHSLEAALFRPLRQVRGDAAREVPDALLDTVPHSQDFRESVAALLREMLVDLAKLKAQLDTFLKGGTLRDAGEPLQLLAEVASGLVILDRLPAAGLAGQLRDWLRVATPAELRGNPPLAERFAEAIAALELYLEALRDALPQPERMLETLTQALQVFAVDEQTPRPAELVDADESALAVELERLGRAADGADTVTGAAEPPAADVEAPAWSQAGVATPTTAAAPAAGDDDPEIREIFLEEAQEVFENLKRLLPGFHRDPSDPAVLGDIRRAFHTLKGSGRMVGAARIAELGWAIEHLLNRCIEGALPVNRPVIAMVDAAVKQLPAVLQQFRDASPDADDSVQALIARAYFLASGSAPEMVELDVLQIFRADALDRLADVERWLVDDSHIAIDPDAVRALHTLKGSAAVVNAEPLSHLAGAFEAVLKHLMAADVAVPPEVRAVLAEALPVLRDWTLQAGQPMLQDAADWLARVDALKPFLPAAGETKSFSRRETLVNLAFDRLQKVEQRLAAWVASPDDSAFGQAMADAVEALTSVSEDCPALERGAAAMTERLRADDLALPFADAPDAPFFNALGNALEYFYQLLDAYREGGVRDSGREVAQLLRQLPLRSPASAGVPLFDAAAAVSLIGIEAGQSADEAAEIVIAGSIPVADQPPADAAAGFAADPLELHAIAQTVSPAPQILDEELASLFVEEARELLEVLKVDVLFWQPPESPPLSVVRVLHTLTGSARMAGYPALGDLASSFERRFAGLDPAAASAIDLRARLLQGLAAFEQAINDFAGMIGAPLVAAVDWPAVPPAELPSAEPSAAAAELQAEVMGLQDAGRVGGSLLDDGVADDEQQVGIGAEPGTAPDTDTQPLSSLLEDMQQPWTDAAGSSLGEPVLRERVSTEDIEHLIADNAAEAIDPELANIFIAEASEMLETIDTALVDWQRDAGDAAAIGELQRALHTLKGGARMTGFMRMGAVSHEMESRLSAMLARGTAPGADDHAELKADLETLEHMHDALSRGHYAETLREAEPERQVFTAGAGDSEIDYEVVRSERPAAIEPTAATTPAGWESTLFWRPAEDSGAGTIRRELARVPVETLDSMLNEAGEISIYRSRLEQKNAALVTQLADMRQTIVRLRDQLRLMDIETDAQIAARGLNTVGAGEAADRYELDFDPLEMDRYSRMQELSRALSEAVGDLGSLHLSMDQGVNEAQTLLLQQGRINTGVQQGLMGTLMVPFSRQVGRLQRVVRQTAQEEGKFADVQFEGVESELDRNVLERMTAPLEHLLRNAVVHGIENPEGRSSAAKPAMGMVTVSLKREGTQLLMEIADDGRGLNFAAIRTKAIERGLVPAGTELGDDEIARFIFEAGFSTAETLTQSAGRGVGMDVVASEVKQLGGSLELRSVDGQGTRFTVRLPLSLALSQALMVKVGEEVYALPLVSIEGIGRVPRETAVVAAGGGEAQFAYGGHDYRVRYLAELIDLPQCVPEDSRTLPVVLVRLGEGVAGGERRAALVVDQLLGNREVVSKAVGPQLSSISGVAGATILPGGEVVLILDPAALVIDRARRRLIAEAAASRALLEHQPPQGGRLIMVVDDSVTMRRVAERLLQRNGYRVITAKDGLEAIAQLQVESPAAILLDIEMPRADGFEVAGFVRNNDRISETPIIMITSRSGDKHRTRAASLGVNRYLIKPYQEEQLLHELRGLLQAREAEAA